MKKYSKNYLNIVSTIYVPNKDKLRYMKGTYMLSLEEKYSIVKSYGSDAAILYEYFHEKRTYKHFAPTDDEAIANKIGWSKSKVTRVKSLLKKNKLLLILKDTAKDGTIFYRTIINSDLIEHYEKFNELPSDIDIHINDVEKHRSHNDYVQSIIRDT